MDERRSGSRGPRFSPGRAARILSGLLVLLLAVAAWSALTGSSGVGLRDLPSILAGTAPAEVRAIVVDVRLPRVLLAIAVGAALAGAGGALQSVLRNPLADPYVLGLSGGAGLGAILWTSFGAGEGPMASLARPTAAFAGSIAAVGGLLALARGRRGTGPESLLLMGVVMNATSLAMILFVVTVADVSRYQGVLTWLVGSLTPPTPGLLAVVYACVAAGLSGLVLLGGHLNLLTAGEETAEQLGSPAARVRLGAILAACLVTSAAVSVSGLIGFLGLMIPHAARLWFGPDNRLLVPAAALLGGVVLTAADTAARVAFAPTQIPVGVITALAGGPCFLWIYARRGGRA